MKSILFCCLLITIPSQGMAQTKSIKKFFNKYKHSKNTVKLNLPGFLFKIGSKIGQKHVEDEEEKYAIGLLKKVKRSRILVMEDENQIDPADLVELRNNVKKEGFSDLIEVRSSEIRVSILVEEQNDVIENILLLVNEENNFVMVAMKTKLAMTDINQLISNALRKNVLKKSKKEELEAKTPQPKKKKKVPSKPRA